MNVHYFLSEKLRAAAFVEGKPANSGDTGFVTPLEFIWLKLQL